MRVNYDQIAEKYNQRYQANSLGGLETALVKLACKGNAKTILEVGCGTGRWLAGLAKNLDSTQLYGLDFSFGMLEQAQKRTDSSHLIQGKASQLAFKANTFDLIFCVNALHHFHNPENFIRQAYQLLNSQGQLAIIGQVPQDRRNRWYVYDYFEGVYETDLKRFPSWGNVMDWMVRAGFETIEWRPLHWIIDDKKGQEILNDPFLQKHAVSQLSMLKEADYVAGIAKIKHALEHADAINETLIFPARLRLDMLVGITPQEK